MRSLYLAFIFTVASGTLPAACEEWRKFIIPSTGASAEIPVSVFIEETELPDGGIGRRFYTDDRRADLTVQSVANPANDIAGDVSSEKKSAARYRLQAGDTELFCCVQRP